VRARDDCSSGRSDQSESMVVRPPTPGFLVNVAAKGLANVVSASVAFTGVTGGRLRSKPEETRSLLVAVASKGVREGEV
jgi:hypothetical protein